MSMSDHPSLVGLPVELHLLIAPSLNAADLFSLIRTCRTLYESFLPSLQHFAFTNYGDQCRYSCFNEKSALAWACRDPAYTPFARSIFEYAHIKASLDLKRHLFKPCHLRMLAAAAARGGNVPILALLIDEIENVSPEFCIKADSPCYDYGYGCSYVLTLLFKRVYTDTDDIPYSREWLHKVAVAGEIESLRLLLQACPKLRANSILHCNADSALHTAALLGCLELAHFCLDEVRMPVDVLDFEYQTPMYYATEGVARLQYSRYLTSTWRSPVLKRDKDGVKKVAKLLVSRGARVSDGEFGASLPLLHFFCQRESDIEMLEILLSAPEIDCSAQDQPSGLTPLHFAVQAGTAPVVERLLAAGADANIPAHAQNVVHTNGLMLPCLGRTPVHYAIVAAHDTEKTKATSEEHLSLCRMILAAAGSLGISARDSGGCTSLHLAAGSGLTERVSMPNYQTGSSAPLMRLLLEFGAGTEINTKDGHGRIPLHYAAAQAAQDIEVLLSGCSGTVDIDARDLCGQTPLHFAATRSVRNVEALLSGGADPSAIDEFGRLPLHYAETKETGAPAFFALLDASDDPNADILRRDANGRNPLASFLERLDFDPLEPSNQIIALCRARGLPVELPQDEEGLILGRYEIDEDGALMWRGDGLNDIFSGRW